MTVSNAMLERREELRVTGETLFLDSVVDGSEAVIFENHRTPGF